VSGEEKSFRRWAVRNGRRDARPNRGDRGLETCMNIARRWQCSEIGDPIIDLERIGSGKRNNRSATSPCNDGAGGLEREMLLWWIENELTLRQRPCTKNVIDLVLMSCLIRKL
jgi:hypothetical protein